MQEPSKFVGLDVHKETIAVSVAEAHGGEVRNVGEIRNTPEAVVKLTRHPHRTGNPCGGAGSINFRPAMPLD